jgi:hypothetical protein
MQRVAAAAVELGLRECVWHIPAWLLRLLTVDPLHLQAQYTISMLVCEQPTSDQAVACSAMCASPLYHCTNPGRTPGAPRAPKMLLWDLA